MLLSLLPLALAQTPTSDIGEKPAALKLDCLAGVCLGSSPTSTAPTLVTVSDEKWERSLEVCAGKVVGIWISHSWYQTGFTFTDGLAGATTPVYGENGTAAANVLRRVQAAMEAKGWYYGSYANNVALYRHAEVDGPRGTLFTRSGEDVHGWTVGVLTHHPDREALCAGRDGAGL
jgi:hypothetical protein